METRRSIIPFMIIAAGIAVVLLAPLAGMEWVGFDAIRSPGSTDAAAQIFWRIRIPRVLAGFIAGAALALSGMTFQAVFRNPLATPFTLGVSSGAAFGAALCVMAGSAAGAAGIAGQSLCAFAWAALSIALVYGLTRVRRGFSTATMLIAGVAVNFFFSSLMLFMQYLSDFTQSFRMVRWLMGGLDAAGFGAVALMAAFTGAGVLIVFARIAELDLLSMGDDIAAGRGVEVVRVRRLLFFSASLMVGGVVSICGPIAFIGMMAPHICRLLVGPGHRRLAPSVLVFGGAFLVACDALARTLIAPAEIPVGVITALLGGPFFLWLLVGGRAERSMLYREERA